jgi:hypothetical protein
MTNTFAPNGFSFTRNNLSAAPTYQTTIAEIASNNANSFGKGDVVKLLNTGFIDRALTSDTSFFGVIDWVEYYDTAQQKKIRSLAWLAPSTALSGSVYASVITDTQAVFSVQVGPSGSGPAVQANVGLNINFGGNAAPTTATGLSTAYADFGTVSTASTYPFRVLGLGYNNYLGPIGNVGYDNTTANNLIEVVANPGAWLGSSGTGI